MTKAAQPLADRKVLLGVSGSIAAYKACELSRLLIQAGAQVDVVMTLSATQFVGPLTFRALTGRPVAVELCADEGYFRHLDVARVCDVAVIAPATANIIAKLAFGLADDLLSTTMLAVTAPVLIAPAMNPRMLAHPAVVANLSRLMSFGHTIIVPGEGELACGDIGPGRLAELDTILAAVIATFS